MMSKCKVFTNHEGLHISLNDVIHLVAYPPECSHDFNELCNGRGGGGEREREERGEKGRDLGGLMIVDCVVSQNLLEQWRCMSVCYQD